LDKTTGQSKLSFGSIPGTKNKTPVDIALPKLVLNVGTFDRSQSVVPAEVFESNICCLFEHLFFSLATALGKPATNISTSAMQNFDGNFMRAFISILITLFYVSCSTNSDRKILETVNDSKGRIQKQVTEGFNLGEGSYRRTTFYDTLGREINILEIKDQNKTLNTFKYSDSSTYDEVYYDLGETKNYLDSNFAVTEKDITFIRHVRLYKGAITYQFTKWFYDDSTSCQEVIYDSSGKQLSFTETNCR
jgi:hypothetical protein